MRPRIAAHRGGARLWPENSLAAVDGTLALGVEEIELDVHLSADDVPVVIHDATLARTTAGAGPVRALPAATLAMLGVPMLEAAAVRIAAGAVLLRLEIKTDGAGRPYPDMVAHCAAVLDAAGLRGRTRVIAFQPRTLHDAAGQGGYAGLGLLLDARAWRGMGPGGAAALARWCGADELGLPLGEWDAVAVAAIGAAGLARSAWGADDAATLHAAFAVGLDGVTTDDPALALRLREAAARDP